MIYMHTVHIYFLSGGNICKHCTGCRCIGAGRDTPAAPGQDPVGQVDVPCGKLQPMGTPQRGRFILKDCSYWECPRLEQGNSVRKKEWQRGAVMTAAPHSIAQLRGGGREVGSEE